MKPEIVLIIGASSDIGCHSIRELAININQIFLAHYYSNNRELEELSNEITSQVIPIKADLSCDEDIQKLCQNISDIGIPSKIVFLAASKFNYIRFKDLIYDDLLHEMDLQLKSSILIAQYFLPFMAKAKYGKIVFMLSSVSLNIPPSALVLYNVVKYSLLGLMKSLATEYAVKQININGISPSMIETKFLKEIPTQMVELSAKNNPFKRNASLKDVSKTIRFLLSEDACYMTGVNIPITGGSIF